MHPYRKGIYIPRQLSILWSYRSFQKRAFFSWVCLLSYDMEVSSGNKHPLQLHWILHIAAKEYSDRLDHCISAHKKSFPDLDRVHLGQTTEAVHDRLSRRRLLPPTPPKKASLSLPEFSYPVSLTPCRLLDNRAELHRRVVLEFLKKLSKSLLLMGELSRHPIKPVTWSRIAGHPSGFC